MSTGKYNLIQLNSIYLTNDATSTGTPCKTSVSGLDALTFDFTGVTVLALDGTPYNQVFDNYKKGLPLTIKITQTTDTRLDELASLLTTLVTAESSVLVQITGSTGDFTLNCLPAFPKPLEFSGDFQNSYVKDITLNFVVQSAAYPVTLSTGAFTLTGVSIGASVV